MVSCAVLCAVLCCAVSGLITTYSTYSSTSTQIAEQFQTMTWTSLVVLLFLCTTTVSSQDLDKELENFQQQQEKVAVKHIKKHEGDCHKTVGDGDRVYLFFSGMDHNTGEVFDTNRALGTSAFIMRIGESEVLKGEYFWSLRLLNLSCPSCFFFFFFVF